MGKNVTLFLFSFRPPHPGDLASSTSGCALKHLNSTGVAAVMDVQAGSGGGGKGLVSDISFFCPARSESPSRLSAALLDGLRRGGGQLIERQNPVSQSVSVGGAEGKNREIIN